MCVLTPMVHRNSAWLRLIGDPKEKTVLLLPAHNVSTEPNGRELEPKSGPLSEKKSQEIYVKSALVLEV